MRENQASARQIIDLRQRAEKLLTRQGRCKPILSITDQDSLVHELELHQIEVSLQNEELRRVQLETELSREKYVELYDFAPIGFFTIDQNGLILDVNLTGTTLLGLERHHLLSRAFSRFVVPEFQDEFYLFCKRVLTSGARQECELKLLKKNSACFHALLESIVIQDGSREKKCVLLAVRDISEHIKMDEERLRAAKLESLGILAGGIAHDFNNLLTAVTGNISMAKMQARPGEKLHDILDKADKTCQQSFDLAQSLLTFAKGGAPIKKAASVADLIRDSADLAMTGSSARCQLRIPEDLWPAEVDEAQIGQVVHNLLINAAQSMPEGGTVWLNCENINLETEAGLPQNAGEHIRITVKDEGIGIPREYLNRIFDPYFTTKPQGSGLGLATAYSIVKLHGGHIAVASEPGEGTTFQVYLPASSQLKLAAKQPAQTPVAGMGRVLVMDDQAGVREVMDMMLQHLGYETCQATDGAEAVMLYREAQVLDRPFDAVILNLTIPGGMGGKQAIKELLELDPGVKAIVSSGYSDDTYMADYRDHGFCAVIPKPFRLEELDETLRQVIGRS